MGRRRVAGIGETRRLNTCCRLWRYAGSADGYGRRRRPREARLVEVHVRGDNNAEPWNENALRSGGLRAEAEIHADPGPRIHFGLGDGGAGLNGISFAPEWHVDAKGGRNPVEHVHGVLHGEVPVCSGRGSGDERRSGKLHDGADGALAHSVELVHMRRTSIEVCTPESARKFVQRVDKNSPALSECNVPTSRRGSEEPLLRRAAKEATNLPTLVVNENEEVLVTAILRADKGAGYVGVNQSAGVRGLGASASEHAEQPSKRLEASEDGASDVISGSRRGDGGRWLHRVATSPQGGDANGTRELPLLARGETKTRGILKERAIHTDHRPDRKGARGAVRAASVGRTWREFHQTYILWRLTPTID
eukprot:923113-Pleurochrysis_carterae.AAC.2